MTTNVYRDLRWSLLKAAQDEQTPLHVTHGSMYYNAAWNGSPHAPDSDPTKADLHVTSFDQAHGGAKAENMQRLRMAVKVPAPSNWTPEGYTGKVGANYHKMLGRGLGGPNSIALHLYDNPHDPSAPGLAHVEYDLHAHLPISTTKQSPYQPALAKYHAEMGGHTGEAGRVARASMADDLWQHANHDRHIYSPGMQQLAQHMLNERPDHEHSAVAIGGTLMPIRLGDLAQGRHTNAIRQGEGTITGFTHMGNGDSDYDALGAAAHHPVYDRQFVGAVPHALHVPEVNKEFGKTVTTHLIHVPTKTVTTWADEPMRDPHYLSDGNATTSRAQITRANVMDLGEHMQKMVYHGGQSNFPHQFFAPRQYGDDQE